MRKSIVWNGLTAVVLALGAATASADDFIGFYAGGGIGSSSVDDDFFLDDSDTGFKAFVGYSLGEFVAVELAYMDGGSLDDSMNLGGGASITSRADPRIINASVVGNLQLTEQFALIGRLGYASIDLDQQSTFNNPPFSSFSFGDDGSEEEISYGVGAVYTIAEAFQLRAEYEAFDVPNGTIDFISVSALIRFRL